MNYVPADQEEKLRTVTNLKQGISAQRRKQMSKQDKQRLIFICIATVILISLQLYLYYFTME